MNPIDIELNKFYMAQPKSGGMGIIFIFDIQEYHYKSGTDDLVCEKWIYWNLGKREFESFLYLDKKFIENLKPVKRQITLRNMKNCMLKDIKRHKKECAKRFDLMDSGIEEFCDNTVFAE